MTLVKTQLKSWIKATILVRNTVNKIPLKRDASGPEGYSDTNGLD